MSKEEKTRFLPLHCFRVSTKLKNETHLLDTVNALRQKWIPVRNVRYVRVFYRNRVWHSGFLAGWTLSIQYQTVIGNFITFFRGDFFLTTFYHLIEELFYFPAGDTNDMVVMTFFA